MHKIKRECKCCMPDIPPLLLANPNTTKTKLPTFQPKAQKCEIAYFLNGFGAEFMRGNYNVDILDLFWDERECWAWGDFLNERFVIEAGITPVTFCPSLQYKGWVALLDYYFSFLFQKSHEFKSTPMRDITIYCPKFLYKLCFVSAFDDVKYLQMCRTFPNTLPLFILHKWCHSWRVSLSGLAPLKHWCLHLNVPCSIYLVMLSKQLN